MQMLMSMPKDSQGLTVPVLLHSSRADTCKLTPEQCAYRGRRWAYWYRADWDYALSTVYFAVAVIAFFTALNIATQLHNRRKVASQAGQTKQTSFFARIIAGCRFLAYKAYRIQRLDWYSPSLGVMLLGMVGFVFFMVLTLAAKPYYWPNTKKPAVSYGNSPPIATRSGWMAIALMPFVIASAAKWSFITFLTGVSHEKLQVFHRWTSWIMFVLALVHTFPFIVFHIWKGDMMVQWKTTIFYWSGTAALIPQAYLNIMSIGPIRNRFYEFFKATHYLVTMLFVVFLFLHCDFRLSSWDYFIATVIVYGLSLAASFGQAYLRYQDPHRAHLELLKDDMVRVTVLTPMMWKPGQHVFVRFLSMGAHALTNHPFTIASIPTAKKGGRNEMQFFIRSQGGLTRRLVGMGATKGTATVPVLLEGPYGGYHGRTLATFSQVLLIAGGSGVSSIIPLLQSLVRDFGENPVVVGVHVVWCVRTRESISWFEAELARLKATSPNIKVSIFITGSDSGASTPLDHEDSILQIKSTENRISEPISEFLDVNSSTVGQRPDLPKIIHETAQNGGSVAVATCGPSSMLLDVRNAVAALQLQIIKGSVPAEEVYLHTEHFSW